MPLSPIALPHIPRAGSAPAAPLLVYLHGAGEVGGETERQLRKTGPLANGPAEALDRFHLLAFHLSEGDRPDADWDAALLDAAIEDWLAAHPAVPRDRLHLTGVSRGGRGVLRLAAHRLRQGHPVSAVAAFCPAGGADALAAEEIAVLRRAPVLLLHCPEDAVVVFDGSAALHREIGSATSRLRIVHGSELADRAGPHDCWTAFYGHPALYDWLAGPAADPADWPHLPVVTSRRTSAPPVPPAAAG